MAVGLISDLVQFVKVFASRVVEAFSTPLEKTGRGLLDFFKGFRPTIVPQEDGLPKFSFDELLDLFGPIYG